jgi:putative PIN family toxin of toxin-antitoxin system
MDTNVLYAGLRSSSGASHAILELIWARRVIPALSQTTLTEYEEILKLYRTSLGLSVVDIDTILDFLCSVAHVAEFSGPWIPVLSDPDDEAFVKLAIASRAVGLVTHNIRHFEAARPLGINLLAPREFLATISS